MRSAHILKFDIQVHHKSGSHRINWNELLILFKLHNPNRLVTAAHCLENAQSVIVIIGEYYLEPEHEIHEIKVDDMYSHPEYNSTALQDDIGKCTLFIATINAIAHF